MSDNYPDDIRQYDLHPDSPMYDRESNEYEPDYPTIAEIICQRHQYELSQLIEAIDTGDDRDDVIADFRQLITGLIANAQ